MARRKRSRASFRGVDSKTVGALVVVAALGGAGYWFYKYQAEQTDKTRATIMANNTHGVVVKGKDGKYYVVNGKPLSPSETWGVWNSDGSRYKFTSGMSDSRAGELIKSGALNQLPADWANFMYLVKTSGLNIG